MNEDGHLDHMFIDVPAKQLPPRMLERFLSGVVINEHDSVPVRARAQEVSVQGGRLPVEKNKADIMTISLVHKDKHLEAQLVSIHHPHNNYSAPQINRVSGLMNCLNEEQIDLI